MASERGTASIFDFAQINPGFGMVKIKMISVEMIHLKKIYNVDLPPF
jgi:hypothetical protein